MKIHLKDNKIILYNIERIIDSIYFIMILEWFKIGRRLVEIIVGREGYTYFILLTSKP